MSTTVGKLSVELGISDDQLRAGLAAAMVQAQQAGQKISQSMNQAGQASAKGGANMNMAILQASRGIQDFQAAGLMGIVNNVEGIAAGFGVGAGVAGMATLAAVAIQGLSPVIQTAYKETMKLFGLWVSESEKLDKSVTNFMGGGTALNARAELLKQEIELLKERRGLGEASSYSLSRIGDLGQYIKGLATGSAGMKTIEEINAELQSRRGVEAAAKLSQAYEISAQAARELAAAQRGAASAYDLTTSQQEQTKLNQQLFQAAIDASGGGENLRTRIEMAGARQGMIKTDARELYGKFATGDIAATAQVEQMLNLTAEKAKIMANDYERVTGSATELRRIEEESIKAKEEAEKKAANEAKKQAEEQAKAVEDNMKNLANIFRDRQSLMKKEDSIRGNIEELQLQRQRTEIIGSSDVFMKNFTAGTEKDPVVNAIEKQTEDLKEVIDKLKELN